MNALLLYPEFPDTFWSFRHALKFLRKRASFPPLGLATVAAMLPDDWSLRLVDLNVERLKDEDLKWADAAFISGMTVQRESAGYVIDRCAEFGLTIVAGGPLFTGEHAKFPAVHHFVLNEAELTLPPFLVDWAAGHPKRIYETPDHPPITDTPLPAWHLLKRDRYASMALQYSRGCPYNCDFCNVTALFGRKIRVKTPTQVIAELDSLIAASWKGDVFFVDDNFIGNKARLKRDLLPALVQWRHQHPTVTFHTEASIDLADDDELMSMMVQAGFNRVFIGIETPNTDSLTECSKNQNTNRDMMADVKHIQHAGIEVQAGFIVGFDSDTESVFQRQIDFIQNSGIVTAMVGLLQAPPGTKLYERMRTQGRLLGDSSGDNVDGSTNIVPRMDMDLLKSGYHHVLKHIYGPKPYYKRLRTFLKEYRPPRVRPRVSRLHVAAFFRSVVRLGITGKERFHYWNLLTWTLVRRPHLLREAVTLAIYGHHFRKVCELHVVR